MSKQEDIRNEAASIAGKTISAFAKQLGVNHTATSSMEEEVPDSISSDKLLNNSSELSFLHRTIPPSERAKMSMSVSKKQLGGKGRGGKPRGFIFSSCKSYPILQSENWLDDIKCKIASDYGHGSYEGRVIWTKDRKPVEESDLWIWSCSKAEAEALGYGDKDEDEEDDEDEDEEEMEDEKDVFESPADQDLVKEEKRAELYEKKRRTEEAKREYENVTGVNKQPATDPLILELRTKAEADRVRLEKMEQALDEGKRETELSSFKKAIIEELASLKQQQSRPPQKSFFEDFMSSPLGQTLIAAAATRLSAPPPPPPPAPDPIGLLIKMKELQGPPPVAPPSPFEALSNNPLVQTLMAALATRLATTPTPPPPAPDLLSLAKSLKDLMPQPEKQMSPLETLKFMKDFNAKSDNISPLEMLKQMKDLTPPSKPMDEVLGQMNQMAQVMKTFSPDKSDNNEGEIEKFARMLEAMRAISGELGGGREEPQKNWLVEGIKAIKEPATAVIEAVMKTQQAAPGQPQLTPEQVAAYQQAQVAEARRRQALAQAAQQQQLARMPQQNNAPAAAQGQAQTQPQAVQGMAGAPSVLDVNGIPVMHVPQPPQAPQSQPIVTSQPNAGVISHPSAQTIIQNSAAETSDGNGIDPQDLGQFAILMLKAIENNAPATEVLEFTQAKYPAVIDMIDSYDDVEEFKSDLTGILGDLGDNKQHVEKLIAKLETEEGKSFAEDFVLNLKLGEN